MSGWMIQRNSRKHSYHPLKHSIQNSDYQESQNKEYKHAQHVYNKFGCEAFQDYHSLYIKADVLLLSNVFENFRNTSIEHYKLDPANFITAASYAWSCMLLKTGIELELITDPKILDIFEK
jgi:hypothetical protein